jgi:hypothetical protein
MGPNRTVAEYLQFSGGDLKLRTFRERCRDIEKDTWPSEEWRRRNIVAPS